MMKLLKFDGPASAQVESCMSVLSSVFEESELACDVDEFETIDHEISR